MSGLRFFQTHWSNQKLKLGQLEFLENGWFPTLGLFLKKILYLARKLRENLKSFLKISTIQNNFRGEVPEYGKIFTPPQGVFWHCQ